MPPCDLTEYAPPITTPLPYKTCNPSHRGAQLEEMIEKVSLCPMIYSIVIPWISTVCRYMKLYTENVSRNKNSELFLRWLDLMGQWNYGVCDTTVSEWTQRTVVAMTLHAIFRGLSQQMVKIAEQMSGNMSCVQPSDVQDSVASVVGPYFLW